MAAQDISSYPFAGVTRNPFNYVKFEQINRDVVTPWLTLDEITQQLNLFQDESQDTYLTSLELATRQAIEDYLGMSIMPLSYRVWYGSESLIASPVSLDLPEVSQNLYPDEASVTIDRVAYYNGDFPATIQVIASDQYQYDPSGNKVIVQSLPTTINTVMTAPIIVVPLALEWLLIVTALTPLTFRGKFGTNPNLGITLWFGLFVSGIVSILATLTVSIWALFELVEVGADSKLLPLELASNLGIWALLALAGITLAQINQKTEPLVQEANAIRPELAKTGVDDGFFAGFPVKRIELPMPLLR